ncbi:DMT family transporter [Pseudogemmobacter faecipullorum]|uniref:DMT family transporter n=1 Tax=Pseudogemmobacter faecipullorum TaxID=2755041 RepID=A0ABS8CML0_9RHOB|nr:DMT family transporter [Pseudogemmobacter faecipullorum]MCB5410628.1 DMT family transporter [Pseudogemmobacter faecipullorum]
MTQDRILPGILLMLGFCALAPLLDVSSKLAAQAGLPVGLITFARFLVQGTMMALVVLAMQLDLRMSRRAMAMIFLRAFFLVISTFSFVSALKVMPIADALAIAFVEPFILLLLGHVIYGDAVGPRRITACVIGFFGALLIIQPSLTLFGYMALWPLGTAFSFALYMLVTRTMSAMMHPVTMQFHTSWAGLVLCLPVLWIFRDGPVPDLAFIMPEGYGWLWLFGVGFWACLAHMCMTLAFGCAPSSMLAPLHYSELIVAVLLGYLIFDDLPNGLSFAGIAVITGSGLYLIWRERLVARGAKAARKAALSPGG